MLFPCHLYKVPGPHMGHGGIRYKYVGCADDAQFAELSAQGWKASLEDAAGLETARDELERKAESLGLKFDGRTADKKLAERIAEAERKSDGR